MSIYRPVAMLVGLGLGLSLSAQTFQPRLNFGAKFEVPDRVLNGAGQSDEFAFAGYTEVMGPQRHPVLYMEYTGANDTPEEVREELEKYLRVLGHYPQGVALQLGLSMSRRGQGYSADVAAGTHDAGLQELGRYLDSLDRKVFVRIGYEANGFWNGYNAPDYREAFRHVTNILRAASDSIATVWCLHPITGINDMMSYYPGDDYVDWWSIDFFQTSFILNNNTARFLDSAEAHQRPVLIGEANPTETGLGQGQQSWDDWYKVFFQIIRDEPVIKGFSYINRDWAFLGGQPSWGNSKLQDDSVVARLFRAEMDLPLYQHLRPVPSQELRTVLASGDGYVRSLQPSANFGDRSSMRASLSGSDSLISYVQFDLAGQDLGTLELAQLWLMGTCDHPDNQDLTVFLTGNEWTEASLTWQNRPALLDSLGTINVNDEGKLDIYSVDITAWLRDSLAAGKTRISFALSQPALPDVNYEFHTRERNPDYPPTLQLIHTPENTTQIDLATPGHRPQLDLYPNPAQARIQLRSSYAEAELQSVAIYDLQGKLLREYATAGSSWPWTIGLDELPAGFYYLQANLLYQGQALRYTKRLIKE